MGTARYFCLGLVHNRSREPNWQSHQTVKLTSLNFYCTKFVPTYQTEDSQDRQAVNIFNPEVNDTGDHYDQVKNVPMGTEEMWAHRT